MAQLCVLNWTRLAYLRLRLECRFSLKCCFYSICTSGGEVYPRYIPAAYGDGLLAGWGEGTALTLAALDTNGAIVEGPVSISARAGGLDDFATYPNGDAGWAFAEDGATTLQVARVTRCE